MRIGYQENRKAPGSSLGGRREWEEIGIWDSKEKKRKGAHFVSYIQEGTGVRALGQGGRGV